MGRRISLFTDYIGRENMTTNYCDLMMKLVYNESPSLLNKLIEMCLDGKSSIPSVGPIIEQQKRKKKSIPDLEIRQESFQILFEVKNTDWFHTDQLDSHIDGFDGAVSTKILFLLCNFEIKENKKEREEWKEKQKKNNNVTVIELTFEELLNHFQIVCEKSEILSEYLIEFEEYLERNNLLPTWKSRLDVVNCYGTKTELENYSVYMCPDAGAPYSHKRALYFGAYWDKKVNYIYNIDGVVIIEKNMTSPKVKYNNTDKYDLELIKEAKAKIKQLRSVEIQQNSIQVFLLSNKAKVNFTKDSDGGLYGSKIYFVFKNTSNLDALKDLIDNRSWSEFRNN